MKTGTIFAVLFLGAVSLVVGCGETDPTGKDTVNATKPEKPNKPEQADYSRLSPGNFRKAVRYSVRREYWNPNWRQDWDKLERLIKTNPSLAAKTEVSECGKVLMHTLAESGRLDLIKILAEASVNLDKRNKTNISPLYSAAFNGHADVAVFLLNNGCTMGPEIIDATILRDKKMIKALLDKDPNLLHPGDYLRKGSTLHWAAILGYDDVVELLLGKGASVNEKARHGYTPLHYAARAGSREVVDLLIAAGADVNSRAKYDGESPLHWAARANNAEIAEYLIEKGAEANIKGYKDWTPLHIAAENGNIELAKLLIDNNADVNVGSKEHRYTPLHLAIESNNPELVRLLVNRGADVNATNSCKENAAHHAAYHCEILSFLISKGADFKAENDRGETPLHWAARSGSLDSVKLLLEKGADLNALDNWGHSPLDVADDNRAVVKYLLDAGANPVVDYDDPSRRFYPLFAMVKCGDRELVKRLISEGVDVNSCDRFSVTALLVAVIAGRADMVEFLIGMGAYVNPKNRHGCTPLHVVEKEEIAELLIKNGADVNAKDKNGSTPLSYAVEGGHLGVAKILRAHGAK